MEVQDEKLYCFDCVSLKVYLTLAYSVIDSSKQARVHRIFFLDLRMHNKKCFFLVVCFLLIRYV
jgi:hypothetical protein